MYSEEGAWVDLGPAERGGDKSGPVWRNISRSMARIMRHQGVCDSFEDGRIYHKTLMKLLVKDYRWLEDVTPKQFIDSLWNWQTKVRFQYWVEGAWHGAALCGRWETICEH